MTTALSTAVRLPDVMTLEAGYVGRSRLTFDAKRTYAMGDYVQLIFVEPQLMFHSDEAGFTVEAAPDLLRAHCPPLMLISLAENAFKHGVEPKIGPARIEVSARRTGDGSLEITVADDGVGFVLDAHGHTGGIEGVDIHGAYRSGGLHRGHLIVRCEGLAFKRLVFFTQAVTRLQDLKRVGVKLHSDKRPFCLVSCCQRLFG